MSNRVNLTVTNPYVWLPINMKEPVVPVDVFLGDELVFEMDLNLTAGDVQFYGCYDVSPYMGKSLTFEGVEDSVFAAFRQEDSKPENPYAHRPKLHMAPTIGWHNDPNGLVYKDGWYHMYYQLNPFSTEWGNLHWGHSRSRDLLHWENLEAAMFPDGTGTKYSGCGFVDEKNAAGFGENTVLFYYTAAGGRNRWSTRLGNVFEQRLAYGKDLMQPLKQYDKPVIKFIVNENRDPKVFYHEESNAYILVMYLDGNEFAIFRSVDLLNWEESQRLTFDKMWECPDLFKLKVEGTDEEKWIFLSADGFYRTGSFDGYTFTAESEMKEIYCSRLGYASQSFANVKDRAVGAIWQRPENTRGNYRGVMSVVEYSLKMRDGEIRLCQNPPREMKDLPVTAEKTLAAGADSFTLTGDAALLKLEWKDQAEDTTVEVANIRITVLPKEGKVKVEDAAGKSKSSEFTYAADSVRELRVLLDEEVVEIFGDEGVWYTSVEASEAILLEELKVKSGEGCSAAVQTLK